MRPRWKLDLRAAAYGGLGALIGASCMTVIRSGARRFGIIEKTVPQVMEEALTSDTRFRGPGTRDLHPILDQVLHLAYGATQGCAYAAIIGTRRGKTIPNGVALGVAAWLLGSGVVLPISRASRGIWRRRATENAVDLTAHLVFGLATELVRHDLISHTGPGDVPREARRGARIA